MIPYFKQPSLEVGPLTFHAFGAMVVLAILAGSWMIQKRSEEQGLDPDKSYNMVTWTLIGGFIFSHIVETVVYHPEKLQEDPFSIFYLWEGMSSFGGFLGAAIGIYFYSQKYLKPGEWWRYIDAVAWGFPFGWIFGRTGCTIALDHPGTETDFFLGFERANGTVIHNLGLYEMLYTVLIAALFWFMRKKRFYSGFWVGFLWTVYAPVRFMLDFVRIRDVKYGGLTPGQWGAIAMFMISIAIIFRRKKAGDMEPFPRDEASEDDGAANPAPAV